MLAPKTHLTSSQVQALTANQPLLVTTLDLYETLMAAPYLSCSQPQWPRRQSRGRSLFRAIARPRSCADAGIGAEWCADQVFGSSAHLRDSEQQQLIGSVIEALVQRTAPVRALCQELHAEDFRLASVFVTTKDCAVSMQEGDHSMPDPKPCSSFEARVIIESKISMTDDDPVARVRISDDQKLTFESVCSYHRSANGSDLVNVTWVKRKSQYQLESCDVPAHLKQFCVCRSE